MGRRHPFWGISVLAAVAACRPAARDAPAPNAHDAAPVRPHAMRDPLGLAAGTQWHFRGTFTNVDDAGNAKSLPITWTTTVASVEDRDGRVVYTIYGWPGDAPTMPAHATYVVVDRDVVNLSLDGSIGVDTQWFTIPLGGARKLCTESEYCWDVESSGKGWDIVYRTTPDTTTYHVETGKGVTRYEYHHNGTADDVVLERDDLE
jgi:hypothetical protein